jgi:hypothetical protein
MLILWLTLLVNLVAALIHTIIFLRKTQSAPAGWVRLSLVGLHFFLVAWSVTGLVSL